eukprot:jgi/Mesvir1/29647/Mv21491-RA.1
MLFPILGVKADIVLGMDTLKPYTDGTSPYFGAVVGRVANRIARGLFELDGQSYVLARNNGPNALHGGLAGFDKQLWHATPAAVADGVSLTLTHVSPDGHEGYPGEVRATVVYTLTRANELHVSMRAVTSKACPINLAQHTYWNLAGHDAGDVLSQHTHIHAGAYTPVDDTLIPTGEIAPVAGTPFDFTVPKAIGADIGRVPGGYDHNFVLDDPPQATPGALRAGLVATDAASGRRVSIQTSAPGGQFYTGNFLDGIHGKGGAIYKKHAGFCFETQGFPDAIHHPNFPSVVVRPEGEYRHTMLITFSTV